MDHKEMFEKAKEAKSIEELMSIAKENGMELSKESAEAYFEEMHKSGELSDEELDNVAGGGCHKKDGRLVVTVMYSCDQFVCRICGKTGIHVHSVGNIVTAQPACEICKFCSWEKGLWLCNHPANTK